MNSSPPDDAAHTAWSDPGSHAPRLRELPGDAAALPSALEGLVSHFNVARALGRPMPPDAERDRLARGTARILDILFARDPRPLTQAREPAARFHGNCRDFALLSAAVLRAHGIPARVRVGFASYLAPGRWEDHWICEHWTGTRFARLDAQLGPGARAHLDVTFDVADLPDEAFRTAPAIWRAIRAGTLDAGICGISFAGVYGGWFVAKSVLADAAALAGIETLASEGWGPGLAWGRERRVPEDEARALDALAAELDPAPRTRAAARGVLARHDWARPTPTVVNWLLDRPLEVALEP